MTFTAVWTLSEADARRLGDALSESAALATDMNESLPGDWTVTAYFDAPPDGPALTALAQAALGRTVPPPVISALAEEDWVAKSLRGLAPVRAGRFIVYGSHDRGAALPSDIAIEIDAGQAFGTGHHGSTAGCLEALAALGKSRRVHSALDVGTGSGVLAIAIAKARRIPVLATDIDPVAVRIATDNTHVNRVARLVHVVRAVGFAHPALRRGARFDLIIANILAEPLAAMAEDVARHLSSGGTAILSGLLPGQRARILAAYRARGLTLRRSLVRDGWLTLVVGR